MPVKMSVPDASIDNSVSTKPIPVSQVLEQEEEKEVEEEEQFVEGDDEVDSEAEVLRLHVAGVVYLT